MHCTLCSIEFAKVAHGDEISSQAIDFIEEIQNFLRVVTKGTERVRS